MDQYPREEHSEDRIGRCHWVGDGHRNDLLALIKKGYSRQEAYSIVQKLSFEAFQKGIDFEKVVESSGLFLDNELKEIFDETIYDGD